MPLIALLALGSVATSSTSVSQGLPRYAATRELTIDGENAFLVPIGSFVVDASGLMYVGQAQDRRILVFSTEGRRVRAIGRPGKDPGEFAQLGNFGLMGDSLWAMDVTRSRLMWFTLEGKFKSAHNFSMVRSGSDIRATPIVRVLRSDGSALAAITGRGALYQVHINPKGEILHALYGEQLPNNSFSFSSYDGGKWRPGGSPNPAIINVSPDGSRIAVATAFLEGERAGTGEVTAMSYTGDTLFTRRYPVALKPIPQAVIDSEIAAIEKTNTSYATVVRREKIATIYPPLEYLRVNRAGAVLLAFYTDGPTRDFFFISAKGEIEAQLTLPADIIVRTFDTEHLWGFSRNSKGVESIVRMRLQKPSGQ